MSSPFPSARVRPNLSHAFGGVIRLALCRFASPGTWLWPLGLSVLVGLFAAANTHLNQQETFFRWAFEFYIAIVLPALAFLSGGGAIRDDMRGQAVDYILTRPVPRWAYLFFRYVAQWLSAQITFLLAFSVLLGLGFYRHVPGLVAGLPLLFAAQLVSVSAFLAFGFLCGVLTSRYVVVGLVYGAVVEIGLGRIPIQLSQLSITRQLRTLLHFAWTETPTGTVALQTSGMVVALALTMLVLAAVIFARRELAGARPSET